MACVFFCCFFVGPILGDFFPGKENCCEVYVFWLISNKSLDLICMLELLLNVLPFHA